MSYQVTCECGRAVPVAATDAGSSVPCGCGRAVEVPPLHVLRQSAGEAAFSPLVTIRSLQLAGRLPGTRQCAVCGESTDGVAHAAVLCEQAMTADGRPTKAEIAAGCLLVALCSGLALPLLAFVLGRGTREPRYHGEDVTLVLPIRVCDECRPDLDDATHLLAALRATPEYADLLRRYPSALIRYLG